MNKIFVHGRISVAPQIIDVDEERKICVFSIASNEGKNKEGKIQTEFFNCIAFSNMIDIIMKYCPLGSERIILGKMVTYSYNKDDEKRYYKNLIVERVEFCGKKEENENQYMYENMIEETFDE